MAKKTATPAKLVATAFPPLPDRSEALIKAYAMPSAESFALGPAAAPPVPPLFKLLNKNMMFRIEADGDIAIARATLDGAGNMPFQYLGSENGPDEVAQGYYTVIDDACGLAGTLTFHFHKPTGNLILSDYSFFGLADGSRLWFKHLEMGTKVVGEAWNA